MNLLHHATLLLCVLGLTGCKGRAPRLDQECTFHEDCTLTLVGDDCCDSCTHAIGTVASVAARSAHCAQKPAASCKPLDCPSTSATAFCQNGRCLLRQGIH